MWFLSAIGRASRRTRKKLEDRLRARGIQVKHVLSAGYKFDTIFIIGVESDSERERIQQDKELISSLESAFSETGYLALVEERWVAEFGSPMLEVHRSMLTIQSQETVDRDFRGSWFHATK